MSRGFGRMDPARQREIASQGGIAAHAKGAAHEWTSDEAREAGRKGGLTSQSNRRLKQSQFPFVSDVPSVGADVPNGGAV